MSFAPFEIASLSEAQRADDYPYQAPATGFVIDGQICRPLSDGDMSMLAGRTAILSVGSNRSPQQLLRKFGNQGKLYVTPVILHDCDIIHSACFSYYGAVPCTAYPSKGTKIALNAVWLTKDELEIMHATEAVGIAYDYCKWDEGAVEFEAKVEASAVYGYSSRLGALCNDKGVPFALSALPAKARIFTSLSQFEARQTLYQRLPETLRQDSLDAFMRRLTSDKPFRTQVNDHLLAQADEMREGPWQRIEARTDKAESYL